MKKLIVMMVALIIFSCELVLGDFLFGTDSSSLYKIDPSNSSRTIVGNMAINMDGLAYIPEPATLLLFGLGGLELRKHRR